VTVDALNDAEADPGANSSAECKRWNGPNSLCEYCVSQPTPLSRMKQAETAFAQ
jgi:hypothetical protein